MKTALEEGRGGRTAKRSRGARRSVNQALDEVSRPSDNSGLRRWNDNRPSDSRHTELRCIGNGEDRMNREDDAGVVVDVVHAGSDRGPSAGVTVMV